LNQIRLHAVLTSKGALRYTPAGVPVLEAGLRYTGVVVEAGAERQLEFELEARAVGELAPRFQREDLGIELELTGFLAPRSRRTRKLVFHVTDYARRGQTGKTGNGN
jgi:primosomal replication protein N